MSADEPERPGHHTPRGFRNLLDTRMLLPGAWPRMLWQQLTGRKQRRPASALPTAWPGPSAHAAPPASGLRVTWLGHSSLLLELGSTVIVTDPVWSEWASPVRRVGPRRFHPPPIPLAALPRPQLALISHNHYDHLDQAAIRQLDHAGLEFIVP
ncbi:MAG TPA: MBL fold metallo-hydrolase, partial [Herpetosiphonaceae bacterium]